jgi:vancomycin resistance protein YoaR
LKKGLFLDIHQQARRKFAKDNQYNWFLTAGKIENLRVAARNLNGIEVKANKVFSFWKHIGKPTKRKGYVVGREIREGCIVPTIAGG